MAFDFPNTPTTGQIFTPPGGPTYKWNGQSWAPVASLSFANEAQAEGGIDTTTMLNPLGATQHTLAAMPIGPFKNLVGRNGGFEIFQRAGGAFTQANATTGYNADGWYFQTGSGQTRFVQTSPGLVPQSNACLMVRRWPAETATGMNYFGFPLDWDELIQMRGKTVCLQFTFSTDVNFSPTSIGVRLLLGTGSPAKQVTAGYTNQTVPILATIPTTPSMPVQTLYYFADIPATIAGANLGQAEVQFYWNGVGTAGNSDIIYFDDVDLRVVPGPAATVGGHLKPAFERSLYWQDMQRCMRFYQTPFVYRLYVCTVASYSDTTAWPIVPMRANPTISVSGMTVGNTAANMSSSIDYIQMSLSGTGAGAANTYLYGRPTVDASL